MNNIFEKKIKKNQITELLLLQINILLALPFILKGIAEKRKSSIINFSLLMGVLGYFFTPYIAERYDLTRHYIYYETYKYGVTSFFYKGKDLYLPLVTMVGKFLGLNPRILGATSAILFYYFTFKIVFEIFEDRNFKRKERIFWFIVFIFSLPLVYYTVLRYSTGLAFFFWGISLKSKGEKKFILFFILSVLSHFAISINIILYYIYILFIKKIRNRTFFKLCIPMSFLLGTLNLEKYLIIIVNKFNSIIPIFNSLTYITGSWGNQYLNNLNTTGKIVHYTDILVYVLCSCILTTRIIGKKTKANDKMAIYFVSISLLFQNYKTLFYRYQIISIYLLLISILARQGKNKNKKDKVLVYVFLILISYIRLFDIKNHFMSFLLSYSNVFKLSFLNIFLDNFL